MKITKSSTKTADALSDLKQSNIKANLKHIGEDEVKFECETSKGGCGCQFTASRTDYVVSNYIYDGQRKVIGKEVACQCPQCAKWLSKSTTTRKSKTTTVTRWLVQIVGRRTIWTVKREKNGQDVNVTVAKDNLLTSTEVKNGNYYIIYEHQGTAKKPYTIWNAVASNYSKGTILAFKWLSAKTTTVSYNADGTRNEQVTNITRAADFDNPVTCYRAKETNGAEKQTAVSAFVQDATNLKSLSAADSNGIKPLYLSSTKYSGKYKRGKEHEYP